MGRADHRKAIIALLVFLLLFSIVIAVRFEWRMAVAAIVAMIHDVVIAAGIYSVFGFQVTPATVIAFLTILGYSLYDTIVVFDRVKENERRIAAAGLGAPDLVNVSTNQVLMRSLNTSLSALLPVFSLLVVGAWLLGQATLMEFALALLIGMLTGAYSSIFVATPVLGVLKGGRRDGEHLVGEDLAHGRGARRRNSRSADGPPPQSRCGRAGNRRSPIDQLGHSGRRADIRAIARQRPAPAQEEEALIRLGRRPRAGW